MMRRTAFVSTLIFSVSTALLASSIERYELLAKRIDYNGSVAYATGGVMIYSKDRIFRADSATYDRQSGWLDLKGDVTMSEKGSQMVHLSQSRFNLKDRRSTTQKLFAYDEPSHMWFDTEQAKLKNGIYRLKKSTISSCDRSDPAWYIRFKEGYYNQKKEYISLHHPTFYVNGVPILYLPWFGFSTNKHRRSGFLRPILGYENRENIFFVAPYYIAPQANWDLEFDPQIRLNRGFGLYSNFRFVDSNHSKGNIKLGYFKENHNYTKRHHLENSEHFGAKFKYENRQLFGKTSRLLQRYHWNDALWIDAIYLNDIDFINLDHSSHLASSKLATSKLNYFLQNDNNYLGTYLKYFIDTEKISNADTLQSLPEFQYHRYSKEMKIPNLLYSFDYHFKHNYRREGLNALWQEFSLPVTFYHHFFSEYLNFQLSENLYYSKVRYTNRIDKTQSDTANYFSNYHKLQFSTDLSRIYPSFVHNIQAQLSYIVPSFEHKSGYFAPFVTFNTETKNVTLKVSQYLYDHQGWNFFYHRFVQTIYNDSSHYKYGDSENQIIYKPKKYLTIYNTLFYSHEYGKIRKLQSGLNYHKDRYYLRLDHTYEYKRFDTNSNFVTLYGESKVSHDYNIFASYDYDFENHFTKEWSIGWKMKRKCWDYMFRYKESTTPNLTSEGAHSVVRRGILFFVRFSPFGGMKYEFNKEDKLDENDKREVIGMQNLQLIRNIR